MYPELTNLLPADRMRALRRAYFLRLSVVGVLFLCGLVVAHALLLLPTYLYALRETSREQDQLAALSSNLQTSEEQQVSARLSALRANIAYLGTLGKAPTASAALRAVLAVPRTGIQVTAFTFVPAQNANQLSKMTLTGTAATRDALRTYVQALSALPFVSTADLPISAYAQDTNIPFTITLTGSFQTS